MEEAKIKEAFERVKQDIFSLGAILEDIKLEIIDLKMKIASLSHPAYSSDFPAHPEETSTVRHLPADTSTHFQAPQPPVSQNPEISIGNKGVPADRQTDRQTDQHIEKFAQFGQEGVENNTPKERNNIDKLPEIMSMLQAIGLPARSSG